MLVEFAHDELLNQIRCSKKIGELALLLSTGVVWRVSRVAVTAVLVIGAEDCRLGTPSFRALFTLSLPLPPCPPPSLSPLIVWYSERGVCSLAISLLFIMAQTYEERWIPYPACVSVCFCVCLRVCALFWGRSTCSVVSVEERAELATLYVQAEVTAQAQWIPLRSECVVLHFEHLEIGGRGELIPTSIIHTVSPPNLRARCQKWMICSVPGGRFAIIFSCFLVPLLVCCASVGSSYFHESHSCCLTELCDVCKLSASLSLCQTGCVCVLEQERRVCTLCRETEGWMLLNIQAVTADRIPLRARAIIKAKP